MKLAKTKLKKIIREELACILSENINKAIQDALVQDGANSINAVVKRVKAIVGDQYDDKAVATAVERHFDAATGGGGFV